MSTDIRSLETHISALCADGRRPGSAGYKQTQAYISDFIVAQGHAVQTQSFFAIPFGRCKNIYTEVGGGDSNTPRIVIGAHYDTLGRSGPGADDNASAVAVVLELIARASNDIPITFVFFDYEETFGFGATKGSRAFVSEYDKPISKAIVLDIVGGALMPGFEDIYFQFGLALPALRQENLDFYHLPMLFVEPIGTCVPRSDYGRFRTMGVPFTFISSGTPWYYHTQNDVPANLHLQKMAALVECLLLQIGNESHVHYHANWDRFAELVKIITAVPAFNDPFFHRLARLDKAPSRAAMLQLYFKVLPALKKRGPELWDA